MFHLKKERKNMKNKGILVLLTLMVLAVTLTIPVLAKPTTFTVLMRQAQFQWRAWNPQPTGAWTPLYQNNIDPDGTEFRLTGNVLHTNFAYSPVVTDLGGESTVYTFDKKSGFWIEHEGTVSYEYEPYYGDYAIVNYWRGYLEFDGIPNANNFEHGVAYQWAYIYAPQDDTGVIGVLDEAIWDETMEAWLVGYSIYLWDDTGTPIQTYSMDFEFIEPVPANDYDPLVL